MNFKAMINLDFKISNKWRTVCSATINMSVFIQCTVLLWSFLQQNVKEI